MDMDTGEPPMTEKGNTSRVTASLVKLGNKFIEESLNFTLIYHKNILLKKCERLDE
jgi:hypothetical protein